MAPYEILFQPSVEKDLRKLSAENRDRVIVVMCIRISNGRSLIPTP